MTDEPTPKANRAAAEARRPDAENAVEEVRYDAEYLQRNARSLLRSRPSVVAAALSVKRNKTFTLEQAEKLVTDHLKEPVRLAGAAAEE